MDPLLKLAVDIAGSEKVAKLTKDLDGQKMAVQMLNAQLATGAINQNTYTSSMVALAPTIQKNVAALKALETQASGGGARGLLQLAYAADDLQYGFRSIVNNIPQALMFLGPGIAGAAGVGAVAINLLINHWGEMTDKLSAAWSGQPIAQFEAVRKKTEEVADATEKAFERISKASTKYQRESAEKTEEMLVKGPFGDIFKDLVGKVAGSPGLGAERKDAHKENQKMPIFGGGSFWKRTQAELDEEKIAKDRKTTADLLAQSASPDPAVRAGALNKIRGLDPALAQRIEENTPEALEKKKTTEEDAKEELAWRKDLWKIEHDQKARDMAEAKQWRADVDKIEKDHAREAKTKRIQGLEDQREQVMGDIKALHDRKDPHAGQILGGAKEALDMYQKARPIDNEKIRLLKLQADRLKLIEEQLKKERRLELKRQIMAVTIAGIVCQELVAEYKETYDIQQGPGCTKAYLCPWANRFAVAHGFLGLSSALSVGGLISLNLPLPFPELAAESTNVLASMYARTIEIQGVGSPVQGASNIAWTSAIVRVTFGPFPWTFAGVDYMQLDPTRPYVWCEQHMNYSSEFITIPGRKVQWLSTKVPLDADWGFTSPKIDMTITCKNMPYLPAPVVLAAMAAPINSITYLGCAPGFLLFNGAPDEPTQASDGTPTRDVSFSFSFRPIAPWDFQFNGNRIKDATYGYWDQVVGPDGNAIIGRSDLSLLIPAAYIA